MKGSKNQQRRTALREAAQRVMRRAMERRDYPNLGMHKPDWPHPWLNPDYEFPSEPFTPPPSADK